MHVTYVETSNACSEYCCTMTSTIFSARSDKISETHRAGAKRLGVSVRHDNHSLIYKASDKRAISISGISDKSIFHNHLLLTSSLLQICSITLTDALEHKKMETSKSSLFEVYLRLRPPHLHVAQPLYPTLPSTSTAEHSAVPERFLTVEPPSPTALSHSDSPSAPTHITIHPPSDSRKRAVEKFGFTKVFEEQTSQLEVFEATGAKNLVGGVLDEGRDGLLATLGVTGSGKVGPAQAALRIRQC